MAVSWFYGGSRGCCRSSLQLLVGGLPPINHLPRQTYQLPWGSDHDRLACDEHFFSANDHPENRPDTLPESATPERDRDCAMGRYSQCITDDAMGPGGRHHSPHEARHHRRDKSPNTSLLTLGCPTADYTWPVGYATPGVCGVCADITDEIESSGEFDDVYTLPNGMSIYGTCSSDVSERVFQVDGGKTNRLLVSPDRPTPDQRLQIVLAEFTMLGFTDPHKYMNATASECALWLYLQARTVRVIAGEQQDEVLRRWTQTNSTNSNILFLAWAQSSPLLQASNSLPLHTCPTFCITTCDAYWRETSQRVLRP